MKFLDNTFVDTFVVITGLKLKIRIVLPYLGGISSVTKTRLTRCIGNLLRFCKLRLVFPTSNNLKNYFKFKDRVPETLQSNLVYKFKRGSPTGFYYEKTFLHNYEGSGFRTPGCFSQNR